MAARTDHGSIMLTATMNAGRGMELNPRGASRRIKRIQTSSAHRTIRS
jgi:hypothetical protein